MTASDGGSVVRGSCGHPRCWLLTCAAMLVLSNRAWACAVCFGDPESDMVKGVAAGVWVMGGVIGFVLTGMAGTSLYWIQRSRRQPGGREL